MPISKERMKAYPGGSIRSPEWLAIRERILVRAENRCEGTPMFPDCRAENGEKHPVTGGRVCLTIAHMDNDLVDHSDGNLRALCNKCHNSWDAVSRRISSARTRRDKSMQCDMLDLHGV